MKNQTVVLLIIAGACGLVAMMGVKQYLAKKGEVEVVPTAQVLVASAQINQGDPLSESNTEFKTLDIGTFPEGVVTDLSQIKERGSKVSRGIGDWIMVEQLTKQGDFGTGGLIPIGMRLATIPVDATTHHSGMLQPGNRIDLFLTYKDRDPLSGVQTETIRPLLEYIEVFAVDNQKYGLSQAGENMQARNISLLVTTAQAMKLQLAKKKGEISTSLRSSEDTDAISISAMTEDSLESDGTEISEVSTLDTQNVGGGFALPEVEEDPETPPMRDQLMAAMDPGGSGPVHRGAMDMTLDPDNPDHFWTMAIHENGSVRVEKVNLMSDEPIDTRGSAPAGFALPPADKAGNGGSGPLSGAGLDIPGLEGLGLGGDESLEEAEGLLEDLF